MSAAKVAITLERETLRQLDHLVAERRFPSRSKAIQVAVDEKLSRMGRGRLARECARLRTREEKALAEEGLGTELAAWPAY